MGYSKLTIGVLTLHGLQVSRYKDEAMRLKVEVDRHEQTSVYALARRDETQAELNALQVRFGFDVSTMLLMRPSASH